MYLFDPTLYEKIHILIVLLFTLYYFSVIQGKKAAQLINRKRSHYLIYVYILAFTIVVGLRPISYLFGDSIVYVRTYQAFSQMPEGIVATRDSLFYLFMWVCSQFISVYFFFLIIEILYVLPIVIGCFRLFKSNADMGILFYIAAFSFYSYAVNGLRNGLALSLVFLAITLIRGNVREKVGCLILSVIAIACHASTALPVLCMLVAYFVKRPNIMFIFWISSVFISLVGGDSVSNIFYGLGFDDRLSDYIHPDVEEDIYTSTGFRWDFILYSVVPIVLGWYVIFKKKVMDSSYLLLLGTYIFANAFWIMVIRAEFSNRFAYLSWFLYPIVLAYPLLKFKIWPKTQGQKTAIIMAAHLAFTLLMVFVVG